MESCTPHTPPLCAPTPIIPANPLPTSLFSREYNAMRKVHHVITHSIRVGALDSARHAIYKEYAAYVTLCLNGTLYPTRDKITLKGDTMWDRCV
jgi:hypothetical protein